MPSNPPYDDDWSGESINLASGELRFERPSMVCEIPEDLRDRHEYATEQVRNMDSKPVLKGAYQQTYTHYKQEVADIERIAYLEAALKEKERCISKMCESLSGDKEIPPWIRIKRLREQWWKQAAQLTESLAQIKALKKTRFERENGKTHWDGCWRDHYACAMRKIEESTVAGYTKETHA